MKKSSKIIFFGNERLSTGFDPQGAPTLQALIAAGYDVVAVVANFEQSHSRGARKLEIQKVAEKNHIPLLLPKKLKDITDELQALKADTGVLVAYGKIIPQSIIDIFPHGILNIHPSLLPQYRGSTPIEQAILDGAKQTGVSIMQLVKAMDAGPVYAQAIISLTDNETKQALTSKLLLAGGQMLIENLPAILDDKLRPTPQDESRATYTRLLTKEDGNIDWQKPAAILEREVRAFADWPKSRTQIFNQDVIITATRIAASQDDGDLIMSCGQNTQLEVLELKGPSGRTMSGADFLRGYKK